MEAEKTYKGLISVDGRPFRYVNGENLTIAVHPWFLGFQANGLHKNYNDDYLTRLREFMRDREDPIIIFEEFGRIGQATLKVLFPVFVDFNVVGNRNAHANRSCGLGQTLYRPTQNKAQSHPCGKESPFHI